jgi:hypothetical protein
MIETEFFLLNEEQFNEYSTLAAIEGVSIDYYLDEFTQITGPDVKFDGERWVEIVD